MSSILNNWWNGSSEGGSSPDLSILSSSKSSTLETSYLNSEKESSLTSRRRTTSLSTRYCGRRRETRTWEKRTTKNLVKLSSRGIKSTWKIKIWPILKRACCLIFKRSCSKSSASFENRNRGMSYRSRNCIKRMSKLLRKYNKQNLLSINISQNRQIFHKENLFSKQG